MSTTRKVNRRDLSMRSRKIMDAVEHGESFTVTRDGREIGELIPLRRRTRFVSREDFAQASRSMPVDNPDRFRADIDSSIDPYPNNPYEQAAR